MRKKIHFILFLSSLLVIGCTRKKEAISNSAKVIALLNTDGSDSLKNKQYNALLTYLSNHENDSVNRNLQFNLASRFYAIDELESFLKLSFQLKKLAAQQYDSTHLAKSLYYIGDYYDEKSQLDSAYYYYSKSEKIYARIRDTLNSGRTSLYKAGILYDAGNFTESEIEIVNALRLLSKTNNIRLKYESYNLMALSLEGLTDYTKALDYFGLAMEALNKLELKGYPKNRLIKSRIALYNNMAGVYEKTGETEKAIDLYDIGLKTKALKEEYPKLYAMLLNNSAHAKMKSNGYKNVKEELFESLKIREDLDIKPGIVASKITIGEYFLAQEDTLKALQYLKESYKLATAIQSNYDVLTTLKLLIKNDTKNNAYYSNRFIKFNDSIKKSEREIKNTFARIAYETKQVEEENRILSDKNTKIIIGSCVLFFFLGSLLVIYRLKMKNKELNYFQEQQTANEKIYRLFFAQQAETEKARKEERNRIAMELHDGIINSVFTTRFNLIQLQAEPESKKTELIRELEKTETEIRKISHNLMDDPLIDDRNLPEILTRLVNGQQNNFNTKFDTIIDKYIDWSSITIECKINIYRIVQEAIQNVNKYARAEKCFVSVLKTGDYTTIRIWDNGQGFNPLKIKQGLGLKNITERVKAINGTINIVSKIKEGTTIEIRF
ncbi:tetratricopeptide repeat-containing sensor histidine kinase [Flavobacterium sp. UBA4197]|uniref:tetratricopeptide repeat-containing sensor histidine kinase n=1 Tax=Flavobacterium sp. UBA4197 TaxID=1946546 RepID=UPI00257D2EEF|nr:tetratricopeptide repeat-containing sensor histidine kinase [Flavobacterium sp. UBA4197]